MIWNLEESIMKGTCAEDMQHTVGETSSSPGITRHTQSTQGKA